MNDYKFGNFIYERRVEKGLTQTDVAQKLGVTAAAVSKWENGSAKPRYELLLRLAEVLDVSTEELVQGEKIDIQPTTDNCEEPPKKTRSVLKIIAMALCAVAMTFCVGLIVNANKLAKIPTNTDGNVNANCCFTSCTVVKHGNCIYHSDVFGKDGIFVIDTAKDEIRCVTDNFVTSLGVTDEWIYYIKPDMKDGFAGIYRIKHNGTKRELLASGVYWYLYVTDEWVYYADGTYAAGGNIFRMKPDGTRSEMISNHACASINIVGEWMYYINRYSDFAYKMRLDGTERTKIKPAETITNLVVEGDNVYTYDGRMLRVKKLGSKEYYAEYEQDKITCFTVLDGEIYFVKDEYHRDTFYKLSPDMKERTKIIRVKDSTESVYMCIIDGWLYFPNGEDRLKMYRVKTDGSGKLEIMK